MPSHKTKIFNFSMAVPEPQLEKHHYYICKIPLLVSFLHYTCWEKIFILSVIQKIKKIEYIFLVNWPLGWFNVIKCTPDMYLGFCVGNLFNQNKLLLSQ